MGTVGLNFGSATSGTGFNVSTTVAQIVSNLQGVETPWKTQLTALQSQDTAISSLGTLFSNLSTDMSTLTDFTGTLAQKLGSSSDQNVLTLSAATPAAIAGTHVVSVSNLAQTSSGYLARISSASDPLTGSVTLQVGSGTALTLTLNSSDNTLAGLASTINSSGVGIIASVLTDSTGSILSLVSGTSGANGNISVTGNTITDTKAALSYSGVAGSNSVTSSGTLTSITNLSDTLSGSISVQVGSGTTQKIVIGAQPSGGPAANTFYTGSGINTLTDLKSAINTAGIGVTASIVTNSDGSSSLQLVSGTSGAAGTLTVASSIADTSMALGYNSTVTGKDANLTVDGVAMTSASNTVANLIPGVTFQLLAPSAVESDQSLEQVQVVIANDNAGVESTFAQMVSDYNSLISGVNAQEGLDSSNKAEPLFGSPTLSLLQQQLLNGLNMQSPNGSLTSVFANTNTKLAGTMTVSVGGGANVTFAMGSGGSSPAANTFYSGSGVNTLSGLSNTINAANEQTRLNFTASSGGGSYSYGTLTGIVNSNATISGALSVQVGSGTAENIVMGAEPSTGAVANTIYTGSGINTLSGLAQTINANPSVLGFTAAVIVNSNGTSSLSLQSNTSGSAGALTVTPTLTADGLGIQANVVTSSGQSTLTLASQTSGSGGALTVNSSISATSATALKYTDGGTNSAIPVDIGTLAGVPSQTDALSGSITIQVGTGQTQTITVPAASATSPSNNLAGLAGAINKANIGVNASVIQNNNGSYSLQLQSETLGSTGDMTVTSNILDTTNTNTTSLHYAASSDINSLTSLGISVNNDGSLTFDAASMDSALNSDFGGVVGFFQNANSWGQTFNTMLTNAGTSSVTGVLSLALSSNSTVESTLNADISREDSLISAQQKSLTTELNTANQLIQSIPSLLSQVNELYSAITGYNQQTNG
ncbi:MAG: flagellar filament capping protein FliD [Terracidiphilus sp.]